MLSALWGTWINAVAIVGGSLLGLALKTMNEAMRRTVMQGIGLALIALGLSMAMKSEQFLLTAAALVVGGVLGELLAVERRLEQLGRLLERGVGAAGARLRGRRTAAASSPEGKAVQEEGRLAAAFVNATLVYCVGAMAILGALDSGLRGDHLVLYTKAMLDGFLSILFASTMGIGVAFSALPVFLYQGLIALAASGISSLLNPGLLEAIITEVTAVGGVLIMGVGINLLELRKIHVASLLPSIAVAAAAVPLAAWLTSWWAGG